MRTSLLSAYQIFLILACFLSPILYFQDLNDPSELSNSLIYGVYFNTSIPVYDGSPQIHIFDLDDIDKMRTKILQSSPTVLSLLTIQ